MSTLEEYQAVAAREKSEQEKARAEIKRLQKTIEAQVQAERAKLEASSARKEEALEEFMTPLSITAFQDPHLAFALYESGYNSTCWHKQHGRMVQEANLYLSLSGGGWLFDRENNVGPFYAWTLQLPYTSNLDEEKLAHTVSFVEGVFAVLEEVMEDYHMGFLEHTLSEKGIWMLKREKGKWQVGEMCYGSYYKEWEDEDLFTLLKQACSKLWLRGGPDEDEDDDERW